MKNFNNDKPQSNHKEFMSDFIAGYESTKEKLQKFTIDAVLNELNSASPSGVKPSSLAAYFYSKGEFAAVADFH